MTEPPDDARPPWSASPSAKARSAVQRCVTALLDELAPERVLHRLEAQPRKIEQYRTPNGCLLQAAKAAVSVSWFADATPDAALGELHVVVWRGTVTRRGATGAPRRASEVKELILRPAQGGDDVCQWEASDGRRYDTAALTAECLALLEAQISAGG